MQGRGVGEIDSRRVWDSRGKDKCAPVGGRGLSHGDIESIKTSCLSSGSAGSVRPLLHT